jgi:hypothetical protein
MQANSHYFAIIEQASTHNDFISLLFAKFCVMIAYS